MLYLPTQILFLIVGERVKCHWSNLNDALGRTKLNDALGRTKLNDALGRTKLNDALGRVKRESRITCMPMLRTPPFFPPKSREKPYLEVLSRSGLRDWLKTCQLIPNQWNFTSATLNRIRFVFYHNIKDNERNLCQDLLTIKNTNSDLKVHALHYANEILVRVTSDFPFTDTLTRAAWYGL